MDQDQINELLQDSDSSQITNKNKTNQQLNQNNDDEGYKEDYENDVEENYENQVKEHYDQEFEDERVNENRETSIIKPKIKQKDKVQHVNKGIHKNNRSYPQQDVLGQIQDDIIPQEEVQSEYSSQVHDQIKDYSKKGKRDSNLKDDDLSEAKSQFVDSSKLQNQLKDNNKALISKIKINQKKQPVSLKGNDKKNTLLKPIQKIKTANNLMQKAQKQIGKAIILNEASVKPKLSQQQIDERMGLIQAKKAILEKTKNQIKKKDEQIKRKEYEDAKQKENERKQKNKKILQQQNKQKKNDISNNNNTLKFKVEHEVEMPEKKVNFQYTKMKADRVIKQKVIKEVIEKNNLVKLKQLNRVQPKLKGQQKKALFIRQKNDLKTYQVKEKQKEEKQVENVILKHLKKDITDIKRENQQKKNQIYKFEKTISDLQKVLKEKQKQLYQDHQSPKKPIKNNSQQYQVNYSQLTSIEKFVGYFPQVKNPSEIFNILDENRDGLLSLNQIVTKMQRYDIDANIISQVHLLLDKNSDGSVSFEQFSFIVETQIKRQQDYRKIMGEVRIADPLDMQAGILDMRAKLKYMNSKINKQTLSENQPSSDAKYIKVMAKIKKVEENMTKNPTGSQNKANQLFSMNSAYLLTHQVNRLQQEKEVQSKLLIKIKQAFKKNLKEKTKNLENRVEQSLRLKEETYRMKNQLQQMELRYLSIMKIKAKRKGYLDRQSKQRQEMEEVYRKAQQYRVKIIDPTKQTKNLIFIQQTKFLAAVIMIQRNYRRRKAEKHFQVLIKDK